ncbi:hypothetical protein PaecuDRAFT_2252 [Paenibacillus curdlanolyticus YK9]|uniref:Uncharacterized protein n=1 Tax=Paenibacillus curdlanolyticus YK9 TaxID=717606 RepID=E0I9B5_9BACL|nr:hypothetical protein PaecuDRAFT_2252 [Paenibacillus curdlanolyticus YK9]
MVSYVNYHIRGSIFQYLIELIVQNQFRSTDSQPDVEDSSCVYDFGFML